MNNIICPYCCTSDDVIYAYQNFICKSCKKIIKHCDICNYYCQDKCLSIFDEVLTLQ